MSKLIIAEKPSVAKSIASALGASSRADGFYEGSGLLVSWCVGHLVSPLDAGGYDERFKKWRYEDLPILPEPFRYAPIPGKEAALDNVKRLMAREDVTEIVNACDAGREGELIFRLVYELAGCRKPVLRLWISSMEDSAIREGFSELRPGAEYGALYQSALCRQRADWLVGINATRLFSVLYHRTTLIARPEYIGKTVNFRTFKNSYKDKKVKRANKEDWVVFDDTQEPIVDEETWLLAQKLRQNVRKADPMGEPTRAAIIEKLVAAGFVERKGKSLIPTKAGINLVTVLPEPLTSPMLTAEWEQKLTEIAKGGADPDTFMDGIRTMVQEIVSTYSCISEDGQKLFAPEKEVVGTCPRCGQPVYEGKKNFACSDRSCGFVLWKNDRFWTSRRKELTKKMAADLLKKGRTNVKGMWSEKKQAAYDAAVILCDTGGRYIDFKLEFPKNKRS